MIRRLEMSHDNVVGFSFSGDVTEEEVVQALSELRDELARHGRIRLLFRIRDVALSDVFTAAGERFRFLREHHDEIERVAIVTDDTSSEALATVAKVVSPIEMETFPAEEEDRAWAWLE